MARPWIFFGLGLLLGLLLATVGWEIRDLWLRLTQIEQYLTYLSSVHA